MEKELSFSKAQLGYFDTAFEFLRLLQPFGRIDILRLTRWQIRTKKNFWHLSDPGWMLNDYIRQLGPIQRSGWPSIPERSFPSNYATNCNFPVYHISLIQRFSFKSRYAGLWWTRA